MDVLHTVRTWGEMIKFSHSVFALPFAVIAAVLAGRHAVPPGPTASQWLLVVLCMVAARSFAMTFNRIVDLEIDRRNPRTASRPLAAGRIRRPAAWAFALGATLLFVAACGGFWMLDCNRRPLLLSPLVLGGLAAYSFTKRFTSLSHFVLGAVIAAAPPAAWIAVHPLSLGWTALLLTAAAGTWIAGFDIIYACQDIAVDRRDGLHSLPARLGAGAALWVSRGCHALTVLALACLPLAEPLGRVYAAGVGLVAVLLAIEQSLVRADDLSRVNLAFFTLNGCVSLIFMATSIADVMMIR